MLQTQLRFSTLSEMTRARTCRVLTRLLLLKMHGGGRDISLLGLMLKWML